MAGSAEGQKSRWRRSGKRQRWRSWPLGTVHEHQEAARVKEWRAVVIKGLRSLYARPEGREVDRR